MAGNTDFATAMTNRSLRTIKTELEFLADNQIITSHQLNAILNHLPLQTSLHGPVQPAQEVTPPSGPIQSVTAPPSLPHRTSTSNTAKSPSFSEKKAAFNEKAQTPPAPTTGYYAQEQAMPAPPAYSPTVLAHATALYAYTPTDAGDLALNPQDRIAITEYMNAEWWKGKNLSTQAEGIFPRSYVKADESNAVAGAAPQHSKSQAGSSGYGNMPLEVSQSGGSSMGPGRDGPPSKGGEQGKKFGKKLGNAAIFGAGATMGGKIVNGIF